MKLTRPGARQTPSGSRPYRSRNSRTAPASGPAWAPDSAFTAPGHLVRAAGIDHALGRDAELLRPHRPVAQPVELAGRVRVGVDGEQAPGLGGEPQQPVGRVR